MNLDALLEIEKKYGLLEDRIDGFAYWVYFRHVLHNELEASKKGHGGAHANPQLSSLAHFKARLGTIWYAFKYHRVPKGRHSVLFFDHERRIWSEDHYTCMYTDLIAEKYPDCVVLERPYHQTHYRPVRTGNLVYTDFIEIKAMVYYRLHCMFSKNDVERVRKEISAKILCPIEEICEVYHFTYSAESILDKMLIGYYIHRAKKKEFRKLIQKIRPQVIVETVGYHMDCMIINELALEMSIPTIELQHGTAGREHTAYNYPENSKIEQFPQYFFTFSHFWKDAARFPISSENVREVGFPYLEEHVKKVMQTERKKKPEVIIFISQMPIGRLLADLAVQLNEIIDREQYEIVYKLHPGEYLGWRERYPLLAESGIRVIDNNHVDLYELFAEATYQIGSFGSTATFEGLWFKLKTYIWRPEATSELKLLCEKGIGKYFDTVQELYQMICQDKSTYDSDMFWKKDALDNMKREIDEIMGERRKAHS